MMFAIDPPSAPMTVPVTQGCIEQAAETYELPEQLIRAVLSVERGKVGQVRKNTNKTYDMGPMQINSIWLDTFEGYLTKAQLINDGCANVHAGTWILKRAITLASDFWTGVGNYHSKTKRLNERYRKKVYNALLK